MLQLGLQLMLRLSDICSNLKITRFYSAIIPDFLHLILIKVGQSDSFDQTSIYQFLHFLYNKVYVLM